MKIREAKMQITRRDMIIIAVLSLVFFAVAVSDLGMRNVPTTSWQASGGESFYLDLGNIEKVSSINVLLKKVNAASKFEVYSGSPSNWTGKIDVATSSSHEDYYCWKEISIHRETQYLKFVFEHPVGKIAEIVVMGENGRKISIENIVSVDGDDEAIRNLIDEQEKIEYPPTYMSQTYFDEIYFVRTAEEYVNLEEPYECVHPPLGKLIIATGILTFGYSPFGWRIMGVIFATLMIPVMYIFGKRMFGTRVAAFIASFLLVFEFMHFTMGRIGTTDTFVAFFLLTSHLLFFTYFQGLLQKKSSTHFLFLAVLFFALGFSTKWIVLFGFLGELFLFALLSWGKLSPTNRGIRRSRAFLQGPFSQLVAFIGIAAVIYLLTFVPYMMVGHSLGDVYNMQWSMYSYHSTLKATHPFASPWWSWPLIKTPVWLFVSYLPDGMVSTITCMGNPAIWWVGTLCIFSITALITLKIISAKPSLSHSLVGTGALSKRGVSVTGKNAKVDFACLFITVIFLFQWLPYVLISRCVFLYHFYPNVPILILAITYFLNKLWRKKHGKLIVLAYLAVVVVLFSLFYPVISGVPVSAGWRENLRWFNSWIF